MSNKPIVAKLPEEERVEAIEKSRTAPNKKDARAKAKAAVSAHAKKSSPTPTQHNMFLSNVVLNNQVTARALFDTGASFLSLCHATAKTLRLELGGSVQLRTANGVITARHATVQSVRIGAIEVRDVVAVVKAEDAPCQEETLVGMTVLRKLHVTIDGPTMTLVGGRGADKAAVWNEWSVLAGIMVVLLMSLISMRKRPHRLVLRFNGGKSFRKGATFFRR